MGRASGETTCVEEAGTAVKLLQRLASCHFTNLCICVIRG